MMSEEPKNTADPELKVTDRRPFTPEGERRNPDRPKSDRQGTEPGAAATVGEEATGGGLNFSGFARYLGQMALDHLEEASDPNTGETVVAFEEASQTIGILTMLQAKTRGNLSPQESSLLESLLVQLKLEYSRRAASSRR